MGHPPRSKRKCMPRVAGPAHQAEDSTRSALKNLFRDQWTRAVHHVQETTSSAPGCGFIATPAHRILIDPYSGHPFCPSKAGASLSLQPPSISPTTTTLKIITPPAFNSGSCSNSPGSTFSHIGLMTYLCLKLEHHHSPLPCTVFMLSGCRDLGVQEGPAFFRVPTHPEFSAPWVLARPGPTHLQVCKQLQAVSRPVAPDGQVAERLQVREDPPLCQEWQQRLWGQTWHYRKL